MKPTAGARLVPADRWPLALHLDPGKLPEGPCPTQRGALRGKSASLGRFVLYDYFPHHVTVGMQKINKTDEAEKPRGVLDF